MSQCGRTIAYGIARYGLGDTLLQAAETLCWYDYFEFLAEWRENLRNVIQHDPKGYIGRKCTRLATSISDAFPSRKILTAYVAPVTSWSQNHESRIPSVSLRQADIQKLAAICDHRFGWGHTVLDRFSTCIWEGAMIRMLCQVSKNVTLNPVGVLTILLRPPTKLTGFHPRAYRECA